MRTEVIQPRLRKPAKRAKQTSGLTTDQEDTSTEGEDEDQDAKSRYVSEVEGRDEDAEENIYNEKITISDDDDPFGATKTSK
jgi:hypothetical protein